MNLVKLCSERQHSKPNLQCTFPAGHDGLHCAGGVYWRAYPQAKPPVTRVEAYINRIRGKAFEPEMLKIFEANPNHGLMPHSPRWQNIIPDVPKVGQVVGGNSAVLNHDVKAVINGRCGYQGCVLDPGHDTAGGFKSHFKPGRGYYENGEEVKPVSRSGERNYTHLQGLLRSGITIAEVIDKYHLNVNRSKRHSNLVQFKYDQIDSDLSDALVQQCRGIIMDEADNWRIVARPFDKFFNYAESQAAKIDWATARVVEKLDGTCCILYWFDGWQVATLGSADASGSVSGFPDLTYAQLFWDTFQLKHYKVPDAAWQDVTFIFELTTPYNRVVVPHAFCDLRLIGSRVASGEESSIVGSKDAKGHGFDVPKSFDLKSMSEIEAEFEERDGLQFEGFVVVDAKYNRIKVKHPKYVRIHHLKDEFTFRNVVDLIRNGEALEFISYFPEHEKLVTMIRNAYLDLVERITMTWVANFRTADSKDFAMTMTSSGVLLKDLPYSGVLFALKNGKAENPMKALQHMHIDRLIDLLEIERPKVVAA
jgi:hypothetical protein